VAIEGLTERAAIDLNVDPKEIKIVPLANSKWSAATGSD